MSDNKYAVPDGMLKAVENAEPVDRGKAIAILEAAIRWLAENGPVPTDEQNLQLFKSWVDNRHKNATDDGGVRMDYPRTIAIEWMRIAFLAPEPEVPEAIKDLLCDRVRGGRGVYTHEDACNYVDGRIIEAYRRGKAQNP